MDITSLKSSLGKVANAAALYVSASPGGHKMYAIKPVAVKCSIGRMIASILKPYLLSYIKKDV
jgi:hypothetical protein